LLRYALGNVAEIIIYNRILSEDERSAVEAYLAAKYNIKLSTTAEHNKFFLSTRNANQAFKSLDSLKSHTDID